MTRREHFAQYEQYEIKRKEAKIMCGPETYYSADEIEEPKINASPFHYNAPTDCYRELLVSYMPMIPLLEKQVKL